MAAGFWHTTRQTVSGKPAPGHFTRDELNWEPGLKPKRWTPSTTMNGRFWQNLAIRIPLFSAAGAQSAGTGAAYADRQRHLLHPGGLPRAERELAATVASKVNGCIYCASVHARKAAQLAKDESAIETLLAVTPGKPERRPVAALAGGNRLCRRPSVTPPALTAVHLDRLEEQGLDTLAQLDLLQSAAFCVG